jgi:hypothetical protein
MYTKMIKVKIEKMSKCLDKIEVDKKSYQSFYFVMNVQLILQGI